MSTKSHVLSSYIKEPGKQEDNDKEQYKIVVFQPENETETKLGIQKQIKIECLFEVKSPRGSISIINDDSSETNLLNSVNTFTQQPDSNNDSFVSMDIASVTYEHPFIGNIPKKFRASDQFNDQLAINDEILDSNTSQSDLKIIRQITQDNQTGSLCEESGSLEDKPKLSKVLPVSTLSTGKNNCVEEYIKKPISAMGGVLSKEATQSLERIWNSSHSIKIIDYKLQNTFNFLDSQSFERSIKSKMISDNIMNSIGSIEKSKIYIAAETLYTMIRRNILYLWVLRFMMMMLLGASIYFRITLFRDYQNYQQYSSTYSFFLILQIIILIVNLFLEINSYQHCNLPLNRNTTLLSIGQLVIDIFTCVAGILHSDKEFDLILCILISGGDLILISINIGLQISIKKKIIKLLILLKSYEQT